MTQSPQNAKRPVDPWSIVQKSLALTSVPLAKTEHSMPFFFLLLAQVSSCTPTHLVGAGYFLVP